MAKVATDRERVPGRSADDAAARGRHSPPAQPDSAARRAVQQDAPFTQLWVDLSPEARESAHRLSFNQATWDAEYMLRNASRSTMAQEPTQNTASETNANRSHRPQEGLQAGVKLGNELEKDLRLDTDIVVDVYVRMVETEGPFAQLGKHSNARSRQHRCGCVFVSQKSTFSDVRREIEWLKLPVPRPFVFLKHALGDDDNVLSLSKEPAVALSDLELPGLVCLVHYPVGNRRDEVAMNRRAPSDQQVGHLQNSRGGTLVTPRSCAEPPAGLDAARLRGKKTSELRALAKEMRLPPAALDDAMDSGDPKAALVALVLAAGSRERALQPDAAPPRRENSTHSRSSTVGAKPQAHGIGTRSKAAMLALASHIPAENMEPFDNFMSKNTRTSAVPKIFYWRYDFDKKIVKGNVYNYPGTENGAPPPSNENCTELAQIVGQL
jgi:hypothetical protein